MTAPESWELQAQLRRLFGSELTIDHEIGRGGMAAVFLAHDPALQRAIAVKLLLPHIARDQDLVQRFLREARTVASLQHPHIVPVFGVRSHEATHAIVMQFIEGQSLDHVIAQRGALPLPHAARLLFEVASALQHAHERGIVHRDVTAANVLLDDAGHAYLTDFGVARQTNGGVFTREGMVLGSMNYMSPEQRSGERVTATADQYALGVLAFELLTGHLPFRGTHLEVITAHMETAPPSLRALRPEVPDNLEQIVIRLLAKAPEDRWPSLAEPIARFERLSRQLSGVQEPVDPTTPQRRWPRARGALIAAGVAGVVVWVAMQWGRGTTRTVAIEVPTEQRASPVDTVVAVVRGAPGETLPTPSAPGRVRAPSPAATKAPPAASGQPRTAAADGVREPPQSPPEPRLERPLAAPAAPVDSSVSAWPSTTLVDPAPLATLADARRMSRDFVTLLNQRQTRLVEAVPQLGGSAATRLELLRLVEGAKDFTVGFDRIASAPARWQDGFETTSWIELRWREGHTTMRLTLYVGGRSAEWIVRAFAVAPVQP